MFGIRDGCPRCSAAVLRFPGGAPRIVPCPSCHVALEVYDQGIRQVVTGPTSRRAPVRDGRESARVDRHRNTVDAPDVRGYSEAGTLKVPRRWALFIGVPVGVALVLALILSIFRARPDRTDSVVKNTATVSFATTAGAAAGQVAPSSGKRAGEPALPTQRINQAADAPPAKTPTAHTPVIRSEPIPASLTDAVRQVAPSVATIFVKESDGEGLGSGFLVHSSRLMVTNYHVIERASKAVAIQRRPDGSEGIRREVQGFVACKPRADLVLLALVEDWPGKPLALAAATTAPGTNVFAVGSPHGLVGTVTRGIVSGMRRAGELESDDLAPRTALVQTDAFFSRGSSGGPLCNEKGEVVGITAFGVTFQDGGKSSDRDVFRFAIAAEEVRELIQRRDPTVRPLSQLPRSTK